MPVTPLAEAESAALGAALQAQWSVGRLAQPELGLADVVAPFVRAVGERTEPAPPIVAAMTELATRFDREVERLYGTN